MMVFLPLGMFSPMEIVVVLLIIAVIFGVSRLPAFVGSLRKGGKEFKKGLKEGDVKEKVATKSHEKEEPL